MQYLGEPLRDRYKREELWLRSDLARLLQVFSVAVPATVALEQADYEVRQLRHENDKQERVTKNLHMELKMRFDLLQQVKTKELETDQ